MNKLPIITAILPCYNHEPYLQDAMSSIMRQNYPNIRIVFIDDNSSDNSFEKAKDLCKKLSNCRKKDSDEPKELWGGYFENIPIILAKFNKNYGPSTARNYGIQTGWTDTELFAFLDCDDWYEPTKINKSLPPFLEFGNLIGEVYSDYTTVNVQTSLTCREFKQPFHRSTLLKECIVNMDSVISKNILEKIGLFDESLRVCEDFDLHLRISEKSIISHIPESLINIRVGRDSSSQTVSKEKWNEDYSKVFYKLKDRMIQ